MANQGPAYVTRSGEACHQQPYACRDTQLYGFFVKGDAAAMQRRLVDPCLNQPSGGQTDYRVVSDYVLVSYAFAARGSSTLPPDSLIGWVPENSWTVWVPTVAIKKEFGVEVAQRLAFFPAYICVDNSWSLAAGREVYGFPKGYGPVDIPAANQPPLRFAAATMALKRYAPDEEGVIAPLMEIARTAEGTKDGAIWSDIETAFKMIADFWTARSGPVILPGLNLAVDVFNLLRREEVPSVFLKQFRDAADGTRACYQAIIEAPSRVTKLHGGGLLPGTFVARAAEFASHPVRSDLGLVGSEVAAEFPFWVNFDFDIELGVEVWKAE